MHYTMVGLEIVNLFRYLRGDSSFNFLLALATFLVSDFYPDLVILPFWKVFSLKLSLLFKRLEITQKVINLI